MSTEIKRTSFDFLAQDYTTEKRHVEILPGTAPTEGTTSKTGYTPWVKGKKFIQRWYMSLEGENTPKTSKNLVSPDPQTAQVIYRYDWTFGIALVQGCYWNWMKELPTNEILSIQIILIPDPPETAAEALPIASFLTTLHPSKNTASLTDAFLDALPKLSGDVAKAAAVGTAYPPLALLSSGLIFGANVLQSSTNNQKNWYMYQFVDEEKKCPAIEWRVTKSVLEEFGSLIRGTLFLAFYAPAKSKPGAIRMLLRPQIRYCDKDLLTYIIPTDKLPVEKQIFIDIHPEGA